MSSVKSLVERRDLLGGILLTVVGAGLSIYSISNYSMGTMRLMGAGMFPTTLGVILALLGVVIALAGRNVRTQGNPFDVRRFVVILGALAAFAVVARYFGMVPGVVVVVLVSTFAVDKLGIVGRLLLCLAMVTVSIAVFHLFFGLQIPLFRWPF